MRAATRVLVVDDEKVIRDLFQSILELEGFQVSTASSAREALKLLREETFDVAVLDLKLPDMNGIHLFHQIERHYPHLVNRVLFLSGLDIREEGKGYLLRIGAGLLTKPVGRKALLSAVIQAAKGSN